MDTERDEGPAGARSREASATQRNVAVNRRVVEAFNSGGIEGAAECFHEEIEVYDPDLPSELRGREAVLGMFGEMLRGFDTVVINRIDMYPIGDRVVSLIHTVGRGEGRLGEVDVEWRDAHVTTFRDGLVTYWRLYPDVREAFADVGLDPDDPGSPYPETS